MAFRYPPKPWSDGQRANLMTSSSVEFMYSQSLKKWIPITPGFESKTELQEAYGVSTIEELNTKFFEIDQGQLQQDSDIVRVGRIWKNINKPERPKTNDIWIDPNTNRCFNYVAATDTWIELPYR